MDWLGLQGKVGFISIVGRPNAGKSTLMNTILNYKLSAVTSRPHTTRRNCLGIYSTDKTQMIFVDTPGIHEIRNKLYEFMYRDIVKNLKNNDVILILIDGFREFGEEDKMLINEVKKVKKPIILVINKIDIASSNSIKKIKNHYSLEFDNISFFTLSALKNEGVDKLLKYIATILPEGPFLFDPEQISNVHLRDIAIELIRESAINKLLKEVPHSIAVQIEKWEETDKKIKIHAIFYVERESQKSILIGAKGVIINEIKRDAIKKLKDNFDKFIDLRFHIKILPKWQNNKSFLKELGLS